MVLEIMTFQQECLICSATASAEFEPPSSTSLTLNSKIIAENLCRVLGLPFQSSSLNSVNIDSKSSLSQNDDAKSIFDAGDENICFSNLFQSQSVTFCGECVTKIKAVGQILVQLEELESHIETYRVGFEDHFKHQRDTKIVINESQTLENSPIKMCNERVRSQVVAHLNKSTGRARKSWTEKRKTLIEPPEEQNNSNYDLRITRNSARRNSGHQNYDGQGEIADQFSAPPSPTTSIASADLFEEKHHVLSCELGDAEENRNQSITESAECKNFIAESQFPIVILKNLDKSKSSKPRKKLKKAQKRKIKKKQSFDCETCDASFPTLLKLQKHTTEHTGISAFHCNFCKIDCATQKALKLHIATQHKHEKPKFDCPICGKLFVRKIKLETHMATHTNSNSNIKKEKQFLCEICSQTFMTKIDLSCHQTKHAEFGLEPIQCKICGKKFASASGLPRHMKKLHMKAYNFKCEHCDFGTLSPSQMKRHVISKHSDEKNLQCHLCPATFKLQEYLTNHIRRHTGIRPYTCKICGKGFSATNKLQRHELIHNESKIRAFACQVCGKTFAIKDYVTIHMNRVHKNKKSKKLDLDQTQESLVSLLSEAPFVPHMTVEENTGRPQPEIVEPSGFS